MIDEGLRVCDSGAWNLLAHAPSLADLIVHLLG